MILAQNRNKRTFQSGHEYRAWGEHGNGEGVSLSSPCSMGSGFPVPPASLHTALVLLNLSPIQVFPCITEHTQWNQTEGLPNTWVPAFPSAWGAGRPRTEVWIRRTLLVHSPHSLTVALSPPKTQSSHLVLGCLELSTMNVIRQPSPSHPPKLHFQVPSLKFYPWPQQLILLFHAGTYLWLNDFLPLLN